MKESMLLLFYAPFICLLIISSHILGNDTSIMSLTKVDNTGTHQQKQNDQPSCFDKIRARKKMWPRLLRYKQNKSQSQIQKQSQTSSSINISKE